MDNLGIRKGQKLTGLIDADIVAYKCAAVADYQQMEFEELKGLVREVISQWSSFTDEIILIFSGPNNFRKTAYPDYKAHRKDKDVPFYLSEIREWMEGEYESFSKNQFEADDVIGSWLYEVPGKYLAISTDKDLRQIPGWHWNPDKEQWPTFVNEDDANLFRDYQILIGDSSDGYKGAPGIGPKKAEKYLAGGDYVLSPLFPSYEDYIKSVHLATILRSFTLPSWFLNNEFPHLNLDTQCTESISGDTVVSQAD